MSRLPSSSALTGALALALIIAFFVMSATSAKKEPDLSPNYVAPADGYGMTTRAPDRFTEYARANEERERAEQKAPAIAAADAAHLRKLNDAAKAAAKRDRR